MTAHRRLFDVRSWGCEPAVCIDASRTVIFGNERALAEIGSRTGRIVGEPLAALFSEGSEPILDRLLECFSRSNSAHDEGQVDACLLARRKNGGFFPVELRMCRLAAEGAMYLGVTLGDATAHWRANAERLRIERAIEHAQSAILITSARGVIEYANPRFAELSGYALEEIVGKNPRMFQSGQTPLATYEEMWQTLTSGKPWTGEVRNRTKTGELYWSRLIVAPVFDTQGNLINYVASAENVTRTKELEAQLETRNKKLETVNLELTQFTSTVAHDLRSPLATCIAAIDLLRIKGRLPELGKDGEALIEAVDRKLNQMNLLIKDLLNYARLGGSKLDFERVDLSEVFVTAVENLDASIQEKRASVTSGQLPVIDGNRTFLVELFQNLIENGIKFNRSAHPAVTVAASREGSRWRISVEDNGIGIDPKHVRDLFVPFSRFADSASFAGTGLGLATCRKVVELHGGTIEAKCEEGAGARFEIVLPEAASR